MPEIINRLCVFAKTGGDGSMAAFWLDEQDQLRIVHLGSGSGSTLVCVLADEPVDFLRLLAIGYDEICWGEYYDLTPEEAARSNDLVVYPNQQFQQWLIDTFNVSIPERATEIVRHPSDMHQVDLQDDFACWVEKVTAKIDY